MLSTQRQAQRDERARDRLAKAAGAGSARAKHVLSRWDDAVREFVRVIPTEYLQALRNAAPRQEGLRHG